MFLEKATNACAERLVNTNPRQDHGGHHPVISPPLKWAGGKRWLVPTLRAIWSELADPETRLVEPFVGGLSVSLGLRPTRALLNDANPHLINLYRWIQQSPKIESPYGNSASSFARARKRFNELVSTRGGRWTKEAAAIFYYLNRTGFNGLCRFNSAGHFNVPFGRYKTINYCSDFSGISEMMGSWDLKVGDFSQLHLQPDDFVYADPPYDVEFTTYSKGGFDWQDQERLAVWLAEHPGPVIASNQATNRVVRLYRSMGFKITKKSAPRRISCNGDRTPAQEIIAYRNIKL